MQKKQKQKNTRKKIPEPTMHDTHQCALTDIRANVTTHYSVKSNFQIKCRLQIHVFPRLEGICFETSTYENKKSIKETTHNVYN